MTRDRRRPIVPNRPKPAHAKKDEKDDVPIVSFYFNWLGKKSDFSL